MSGSIEIDEVKRKSFSAMSQDGIEKILAGIVLIFLPLVLIDMIFLAVLVIMAIFSLTLKGVLRRKLIYGRIGYVKFSMHSEKREVLFTILYILVFLSLLFVVSIKEFNIFKPLMAVIIPAGAIFAIAHFRTKIKIDYVMSFLVLLSGIIGLIFTLSGHDSDTVSVCQFGGLGVVFLGVGIFQLVGFLRQYPKVEQGV
ncbi:MAG: hypothetical protein JSV98_10815 [candidate division WOR-3 bacterium]|nr:MAG: hypothetical protein JSV98_10815 [candidate division WOR-3 bacterium]